MENMIKVSAVITKAGYKALMEGTGKISKGGIRDINTGQLVELFQPVPVDDHPEFNTTPSLPAVSVKSMIAKPELKQLQSTTKEMNVNLKTLADTQNFIKAFSVLNTAVSLANCGISIAGFLMMKNEIAGVKDSINGLLECVEYQALEKKIKEAKHTLMNLQDIIQQCSSQNITPEFYSMAQSLNQAKIFIENIIDDFNNKKIPGDLGCNIIFQLSPVFMEAIWTYSSRYYYTNNDWPVHYEEWMSFTDKIKDGAFKKHLKQYMYKKFPTIPTSQLTTAYNEYYLTIEAKEDSIAYYKSIVPQIEMKTYYSMSDILSTAITEGNYYVLDEEKDELVPVNQMIYMQNQEIN